MAEDKKKKTAAGNKKGTTEKKQRKVQKPDAKSARAQATGQAPAAKSEAETFPVVGIGASAGGLEAFEFFFRNLPKDINASFVLIQHLGTEHPSILRELVGRFTQLPVTEVTEGMRIEPQHVYVIPVKVYIALHDGTFKVTERSGVRPHIPMPIDFFFRSLANERGEKAVAILLSGTGTDGTLGLRDINGVGGVTIVQDPADARFAGMPESAVTSGHADYVLPAAKIGEQLKQILDRFLPSAVKTMKRPSAELENVLARIITLVRLHTHHDFTHYKKSTIIRRIERRMVLHNITNPEDYIKFLEQHREEVVALFNEFLIRVTSFFRDPDAFDMLRREIVPRILGNKPEDYTVRIWVPGCSTGEEAYSIAMVFQEYLEENKKANPIQVFGTDVDGNAVDRARTGIYPANIAGDVSEERLRRFFMRDDAGFRVKKDLRENIVFAVQDLVKDPPFTRLDLVSCRNVMIYMDSELQNRVIPLFHYSLKPTGILFLGPSEGIASFSDLFTVADRKWKVFEARTSIASRPVLPESLTWTPFHGRPKEEAAGKPNEVVIGDVTRRRLLRHFTPPAVVVDERGSIIFVQGETGKYLQPAEGAPVMNVFDMAREGMRAEIRLAVSNAREQKKEIVYQDLPVKTNGGIHRTTLRVVPLTDPGTENLMLVVFEDVKAPAEKELRGGKRPAKGDARLVEHLQEELRLTKEHLQATVEELQSSNEELRSANEELQSTNEEVQSTNEELETSREELQSVNEELVTVNAELQSKIEQLSRTEIDMKNLLEGIKVATIFVDASLRVVRFTEEATKLVNLIPSDAGRPLGDIVTKLRYTRMIEDAKGVLNTLQYREGDVQVENGDWYHMRMMPYKSQEQVIQGVVITFSPSRDLKDIERLTRTMKELTDAIIETDSDPLAALDQKYNVVVANGTFCALFQTNSDGCLNHPIYDVTGRFIDSGKLGAVLKDLPSKGSAVERTVKYQRDGSTRALTINGRRFDVEGMALPAIILRLRLTE